MKNADKEPAKWRSMSPDQYLKHRVDDQLNWYSKKSCLLYTSPSPRDS